MLQLIGFKRLIIIAILLSLNVVLGAAVYGYLVPENKKKDSELSALKSKISQIRSDTFQLEDNYKLIQEQKFDYENLVQAGYFNTQDRLAFRRRMTDIQRYTQVLRASFDIAPAGIEANEKIKAAEHVILKSPVSVDIEALDDVDFYNFLFWLENGFPGHSQITSLNIKREEDVDDQTLRAIGSGTDLTMITGSVKFDWRTFVPENQIAGDFTSLGEGEF